MASKTYEFLKNIASGEEIHRWNYPDNLIYDVKPGRSPKTTKIVITFDNDDDFLDVIGIPSTIDDVHRYRWYEAMGRYDRPDIDVNSDEWNEGYIIGRFNETQIAALNEVLKIIEPGLQLTDTNHSLVAKKLRTMFDSIIEEIEYDWAREDEECRLRGMRKEIESETDKPFNRFGIVQLSHGYKFETTVGSLLALYKILKAEDEDIKGLLTNLVERYNLVQTSDWTELKYNVFCDDFDDEAISNSITSGLDSMLEEALETISNNPYYEDYVKLADAVTDLGGFGSWIPIPKGGKIKFMSLDRDTNLLTFVFAKDGDWRGEVRSVDNIDDLNTMLYHPELFETIQRILKILI